MYVIECVGPDIDLFALRPLVSSYNCANNEIYTYGRLSLNMSEIIRLGSDLIY